MNTTPIEVAVITTTAGELVIAFWPDVAPNTVANFKKLAQSGFYDGTCFHRIVKDFMVQGGDPLTKEPAKEPQWGTGGPGYQIKCETANNPRKHLKGALSMAHAGKDTGGSQFFITHRATPHLDGVHTVFGQVTKGQEVVDAIRVGDRMKKVTVS